MAITVRTFPSQAAAKDFYSQGGGDALYNKLFGSGATPAYGAPGAGALGTGTLAGQRTGRGSESAGYVPLVPDPLATQKETIEGNIANLPYLQTLIDAANRMETEQAIKNRELAMPGAAADLALMQANARSKMQGQISPETRANMAIAAAERGINTGSWDSPNANAALLRALGLETEKLKTQGAAEFAAAVATAPMGQKFDWSKFLSLPNEMQQWKYLANVLQASPDPAAAQAARFAAAQAGMATGLVGSGGLPSGFQGYMNSGDWLWNTLPRGGNTSANRSVVDQVAATYAKGGNGAQTPSPGGWGYVTDDIGNMWGTVGNKAVEWPAYSDSPNQLAPDMNEGSWGDFYWY